MNWELSGRAWAMAVTLSENLTLAKIARMPSTSPAIGLE